jgi:HlyD family secretion protein
MKHYIKPVLISAMAVAVALIAASGCKPKNAGIIRYDAKPAPRGDITEHITASGSLSNIVSVDVGCQVSGKIVALYVDYNSPVKKGDLVAEIDKTVYDSTLRQVKAELSSAKADLALKQQTYERKKTLVPKRAASQQDLDSATAELDQARASVEMREAAVTTAEANLGYCKISAPVDGVVIARKVDMGQTVNAAMNTPVLFTVAQDMTRMNISATVSEADIGLVKEGQSVGFSVEAFPEETFRGKVKQVRKSPTTTQNVVTYETIIAVDNPEQKLFPGMTADVEIFVASRTNVIKIPNTALRYKAPTGAQFDQAPPAKLQPNQRLVYSVSPDGMKLKPLIIRTGISDGTDTEVLDGLSEGTQVVIATLSGVKSSGGGSGGPPPGP